MASSINWPLDIPHLDQIQFEEVPNVIRSATDVGPALVRREFTAVPKRFSGRLLLEGHQLVEFRTWKTQVVKETGSFNYEDPETDKVREMRFFAMTGFSQRRSGHHTHRLWEGRVTLEILPDAT